MPCNNDYQDPTPNEIQHRRAAKLLLYVYGNQTPEVPAPDWIKVQAGNPYADDSRLIPLLCEVLRNLPEHTREYIVYGNPRSKIARDLADWWEDHQEADRLRQQREDLLAERTRLRRQAAAKLTVEERSALGLRDHDPDAGT